MAETNPQAALDAAVRLAQAQALHTSKEGYGDNVVSSSTTRTAPTDTRVLSTAGKFLAWLDKQDRRGTS